MKCLEDSYDRLIVARDFAFQFLELLLHGFVLVARAKPVEALRYE